MGGSDHVARRAVAWREADVCAAGTGGGGVHFSELGAAPAAAAQPRATVTADLE